MTVMQDFANYSLLRHNTFNIDVHCRRFVEVDSAEEALQVFSNMSDADFPLLIIGQGSNLLFTGDYPSTVVRSAIKGIKIVGENDDKDTVSLRCGSGCCWDDVVEFCVENGLYGAENLSLIPGDVGASAVQNIGAYGAEVKDLISEIEAIDIESCKIVTISASDCNYGYRQSRFKNEWRGRFFITKVTYKLSKTFRANIDYGRIKAELEAANIVNPTARDVRNTVVKIRREMLPDTSVEGNAGSFFVNPIVDESKYNSLRSLYGDIPHYLVEDNKGDKKVKIPAGWLIEQCGWKGKSLGRAGVHSRQALVLVNRGGATGKEIIDLCNAICRDVTDKFGITIQPEVNII